jgi:hypothetical protein
MHYQVDFVEISVEVEAGTALEAVKKAFLEGNPVLLPLVIRAQPESGQTELVPTAPFLQEFDREQESFYHQVATKLDDRAIAPRLRDDTYRTARGLCRRGPRVIPALIRAMEDLALGGRMATAQQLGVHFLDPAGQGAVEEKVQNLLLGGVANPCRPAAFSLSLLGAPSVGPLMNCLTAETDWLVKDAAAWALGQIGDARAVPALRSVTQSWLFDWLAPNPLSRTAKQAISAIGKR